METNLHQPLAYFGDRASFHHVGVAVPAITTICPDCQPTLDPIQKVKVAFISLHGLPLELIEPVGADSPVAASLGKGIKLLHLCFEVENLEAALREARQHGFHLVRPPAPAEAFGQQRIAFVFSRDHGVVELLERAPLLPQKEEQ